MIVYPNVIVYKPAVHLVEGTLVATLYESAQTQFLGHHSGVICSNTVARTNAHNSVNSTYCPPARVILTGLFVTVKIKLGVLGQNVVHAFSCSALAHCTRYKSAQYSQKAPVQISVVWKATYQA